jgi:hypothetical protein
MPAIRKISILVAVTVVLGSSMACTQRTPGEKLYRRTAPVTRSNTWVIPKPT